MLSVRETKLVNEKSKINIENKEFLNTIKKQQRKNKKEKLVAPLIVEALRNKERMLFTPISPTKLSLNNFQKCKKIERGGSCHSVRQNRGRNGQSLSGTGAEPGEEKQFSQYPLYYRRDCPD